VTPMGDGRSRLFGILGAEDAALFDTTIGPLSTPLPGPDGAVDKRAVGVRNLDALMEVFRLALATDALPDNGGNRPQLNVTVNFDVVAEELGVGTLDTERISPGRVRRVACDALIMPAVLDSRSELLDLGRAKRLYLGPIRRALILRVGGCAFPCCDRPPKWC